MIKYIEMKEYLLRKNIYTELRMGIIFKPHKFNPF